VSGVISSLKTQMTWADAAYEVLRKAREPLKPNEIVEQAIRLGLITRKPKANIQMASSIRADANNRFFSLGAGRYGLREWLKRREATIADLAFWILKSENKPLHYKDIAAQISKVRDLGKTPDIAVHVILKKYGLFKQLRRGIFGLRRWKPPRPPFAQFVYATPSQYWRMPNSISKFLSSARQIVRICNPYIDKSTFQAFLSHIPKEVETQLVLGSKDVMWKDKVTKGLSEDYLKKFNANRRLTTRRVDDLHSRFIVVDDMNVCLLSADLQRDQQTNKYQYSYFTNDTQITTRVISYFNELWNNGDVCDLEADARAAVIL